MSHIIHSPIIIKEENLGMFPTGFFNTKKHIQVAFETYFLKKGRDGFIIYDEKLLD